MRRTLAFEAAEEILRNGVVVRTAPARHALPDSISLQALPIGPGRILHAAVAVKDQAPGRFTAVVSHIQSSQRQLGADPVREGVACGFARTQVLL